MYITVTRQKTVMWLVVLLKCCQLQSLHEVEAEHTTDYGLSKANTHAFSYGNLAKRRETFEQPVARTKFEGCTNRMKVYRVIII
jgi:hypothetical protein